MREEYTPSIRLFLEADLAEEMVLKLDKAQSHYLVTVMRQKTGSEIEVFNGRSGCYLTRLEHADRKGATLRCVAQLKSQVFVPDIWFLFAPIKRTRLDFMAQKATELGASAIWPIFTAYTQMGRINEDRLYANAVEAAEQSGRMDVPQIKPAQRLANILSDWPADRYLIFCDEMVAGQSSPRETLQSQSFEKAAILIGPEGGFSAEEREILLKMPHLIRLSLGPRILRADTAGLSALTLVQSFCGDWVETS